MSLLKKSKKTRLGKEGKKILFRENRCHDGIRSKRFYDRRVSLLPEDEVARSQKAALSLVTGGITAAGLTLLESPKKSKLYNSILR
jgi:hypothetical protein